MLLSKTTNSKTFKQHNEGTKNRRTRRTQLFSFAEVDTAFPVTRVYTKWLLIKTYSAVVVHLCDCVHTL